MIKPPKNTTIPLSDPQASAPSHDAGTTAKGGAGRTKAVSDPTPRTGESESKTKQALQSLPRLVFTFARENETPFSPISAVNHTNIPKWVKRTSAGAFVPYHDREEILRQDNHQKQATLTVSVFSRLVQTPGTPLDDLALENAEAWVKERQIVQKVATSRIMRDALKLDARIASAKAKMFADGDRSVDWNAPVIIFLRGNSGAGKSTTIRESLPKHLAALNIAPNGSDAADEMGALNPDDAKFILRGEDERKNINTVSQQYAYEGSICVNRVFAELIKEKRNIVFDKRFLLRGQIDNYLQRARAVNPNYRAVIVDLDAPLQASAEAILSRPERGRSPNVPWNAINMGFLESREHRKDIFNFASEDPLMEYYCFSRPSKEESDRGAKSILLTAKTASGKVTISDADKWDKIQTVTSSEREDMLRVADRYADLIDLKSQGRAETSSG